MDLARCVEALETPGNWLYQRHFVRNLKRRMRRKSRLFPDGFLSMASRGFAPFGRSTRRSPPHHGFRDAADYYHRASALRVVDRITRADAHHFRRGRPVRAAQAVRRSGGPKQPPHLSADAAAGGHCGFVEAAAGSYDGYGRSNGSWSSRGGTATPDRPRMNDVDGGLTR